MHTFLGAQNAFFIAQVLRNEQRNANVTHWCFSFLHSIICFMFQDVYNTIKQNLEKIRKKKRVSIEAAHIYADQLFSEEVHGRGAKIGVQMTELFESFGHDVTQQLFIDDFNPKENIIDASENAEWPKHEPHCLNKHGKAYLYDLKKIGYKPHEIIWESDMHKKAVEYIENGIAAEVFNYNRKGDIFITKHLMRIKLWDGRNGGKPTCALLDAMRVLEELKKYDLTITIFEDGYKKQQKKVMSILEDYDVDLSRIITIGFTPEKSYFGHIVV